MDEKCPRCKGETVFLMYDEENGGEIHNCLSCDWMGTIHPADSDMQDDEFEWGDESVVDWGDC